MWHFIRPDALHVWNNSEVRSRLSWYYNVMTNIKPAKYLIVKKTPCYLDLDDENTKNLWYEHDKLSEDFKSLWSKIKNNEIKIDDLPIPKKSLLDLKIELVRRMLEKCCFCERRCSVNRLKGEKGFCKLNSTAYVSSYFAHMGEEAPLVPSGTIFFSSCNFRCVFCQNHDISQEYIYSGEAVTPEVLARISKILRKEGCKNINYVGGDPTPDLHIIIESLKYLDVNVPLLWNSNMYCSTESMKILMDIIDIWLPDYKYGNNTCAEKFSKVRNYVETVSRNHILACKSGDVIIRHLVLPNHIECCTKPILEWIAKNCSKALVNVMQQYRPEYIVARNPRLYPEIARRLASNEINRAYSIADSLKLIWKPVS